LIKILVQALTVPVHLGLINGPFVLCGLISSQGSPVPGGPPDLAFNFDVVLTVHRR